MRRWAALAVAVSLPSFAQAQLTPSPELAAKLEALEARRAPIEALRSRAFGLSVSAYTGYVVALVGGAWAAAEQIAFSASSGNQPLGGHRYRIVVPTAYMALGALGVGVLAVVLHIASRVFSNDADHRAEDLADEERDARRPLAPRTDD